MSARHPGIRARLTLSFLAVLVAPLVVSVVVLLASLSFFIPQSEDRSAAEIGLSLQEGWLPDMIEKLQLEKVQTLLAGGDTDGVAALVKGSWPLLTGDGDSAEIVRSDGTILFSLSARGAILGGPRAPVRPLVPGDRRIDLAERFPALRALGFVVPGLFFVDAGHARYVWALASDAEGPVYGRYTFEIPGHARAVASVSGQYTVIAVLAGIATFAILVVLLSWRMSRGILVPLRRFSEAAETIASGNLDVPVTWERRDEFGRLASVFEVMRVRLRESLVRLQRADSDRKHLVATITHDLKTPLTSVRGYVEGLRDGVADNPAARDRYFAVILDKTAQLEGLIDGLFRISRLELNDADLRLQPASSRSLLGEIFSRVRRDVEAAGLVFVLEEPVPERTVHADAGAIAQVIDNLVQNAKRYTPAGGTIRASVADLGSMLEISIADTGSGIPPEDLPHVFALFYRGDPARSGGRGEAGLGLAICKRIVERHGGSIRAENREGAVMTFTLPATSP